MFSCLHSFRVDFAPVALWRRRLRVDGALGAGFLPLLPGLCRALHVRCGRRPWRRAVICVSCFTNRQSVGGLRSHSVMTMSATDAKSVDLLSAVAGLNISMWVSIFGSISLGVSEARDLRLPGLAVVLGLALWRQ